MKTRNRLKSPAELKIILLLPAIVLMLFTLASCSASRKSLKSKQEITPSPAEPAKNEPYVVVEEMPLFPGGDSALLGFIAVNTKYPEAAKAKNVHGRVIVRFCVTDVGGIDRASVLRGVSSDLDAEAIRVVNSLPSFKPGRQGGKPVAVWYMVPITFALNPKPPDGMAAPLPPPAPPTDNKFTLK